MVAKYIHTYMNLIKLDQKFPQQSIVLIVSAASNPSNIII